MADEQGAVLADRYELLSQLGRGAMGVVWRAKDRETGQIVAVKVLQAASVDDPEVRTRFDREADLAAKIESRRVVKVLGHGIAGDQPFIVMELIEGHSLREVMSAHGRYRWDEIRPFLLTIARALADAHAEGVIHRDVKPSNILVTLDGSVKLADFGVARSFDQTRLTRTSATLGTPAYMAPEGSRDQRSDLYALGVVGYEMMAGRPPFTGDTPQEVLLSHLRTEPDLSKIPVEARQVIGWLLAKDPARRPQSAEALIAAIQSGDTGTVSMPMPAGHGSSKKRLGALLGGLLLVLIVAAVAVVGSGVLAPSKASPTAPGLAVGGLPSASLTPTAVASGTDSAVPSPTDTAAAQPQTTVTPTPPTETPGAAASGPPLPWSYVADWSMGLNGWSKSDGFDVRLEHLINDGSVSMDPTRAGPGVQAPFLPPTANYAVEVTVQLVSPCSGDVSIGIVARWDGSGGGYALDITQCQYVILRGYDGWRNMAKAPWNPTGTHTYRLELMNDVITVLIDGKPQLKVTDLRFPNAGRVGMWDISTQLIVTSFKIVPLP